MRGEFNQKLIAQEDDIAHVKAELKDAVKAAKHAEIERNALQKNLQQAHAKHETDERILMEDLTAARKDYEIVAQRVEILESDIPRLEDVATTAEESLVSAQAEAAALAAELTKVRSRVEAAEQTRDAAQTASASESGAARQRTLDVQGRSEVVIQELDTLRAELERISAERDVLLTAEATAIETAESANDVAEERILTAEAEAEELAQKLDEQAVETEGLRARLHDLESQLLAHSQATVAPTAVPTSEVVTERAVGAVPIESEARMQNELEELQAQLADTGRGRAEERAKLSSALSDAQSQLQNMEQSRQALEQAHDNRIDLLERELADARGGMARGAVAIDIPDATPATDSHTAARGSVVMEGVTNLTKLLTGKRVSMQVKLYLVAIHVLIVLLALRCAHGTATGTPVLPV
jgi:DNA repair exonuclease SbcCD ATPase subunit